MSLTCVVGSNTINTFEHDKEQIRKWSNKGILKCSMCGEKMIYKHGEYKIPHFAHEHSCELEKQLIYSQPETEEHMSGKRVIYEWLKTQNVENLKLEAWIPETKQRPDIYFEKDGIRYVIEYQCTPIATKYAERHRLYELAGIEDIWVFGTEKYDFVKYVDNFSNIGEYSTKTIEREIINSKKYHFMHLKDTELYIPSRKTTWLVSDVVKYSMKCEKFNILNMSVNTLISRTDVVQKIFDDKELRRIESIKVPDYKALKKCALNMSNSPMKISNAKYQFVKNNNKYLCEVISFDEYQNNERYHRMKIDYNYIPFFGKNFENIAKGIDTTKNTRHITQGNYIVGQDIYVIEEFESNSYSVPFRSTNKRGRSCVKYGYSTWYKYSVKVIPINKISIEDLFVVEQNKINFTNKVYITDGYYKPKSNCHTLVVKEREISNSRKIYKILSKLKTNKEVQFVVEKIKTKDGYIRRSKLEMESIKDEFCETGCQNIEIYWG